MARSKVREYEILPLKEHVVSTFTGNMDDGSLLDWLKQQATNGNALIMSRDWLAQFEANPDATPKWWLNALVETQLDDKVMKLQVGTIYGTPVCFLSEEGQEASMVTTAVKIQLPEV